MQFLERLGPIANQAKLATVGYGLLVVSLVTLSILAAQRTNMPLLITTILLTAVSALIGIYSVNCMVYGSCHVLAWAVSVAVTIVGAFYLLLVIFLASMKVKGSGRGK